MADEPSDLLILGASMAGIELLYQLRRAGTRGRGYRVTVVDRQTTHGYIPLVQERLCETLPLVASRLDTRAIVEADARAQYVVGDITGFDPETREVTLADGRRLRGSTVVVALGSVMRPPAGISGGELLLGYKLEAAFARARAAITDALERAEEGPARFVVVGGGISGVELAGELAAFARQRPAGRRGLELVLIQRGARLLPLMSRRAGRLARRSLEAQGVEVRRETCVSEVRRDGGGLEVCVRGSAGADGPAEVIRCEAAFWAGGVRPAPVLSRLGLPLTEDGWLKVGPTMQCFTALDSDNPRIFACGDAARIYGGDDARWPTMQRAIECIWQATLVARNVVTLGTEGETTPLRPHTLREDFFHGVSMGRRSMIVYGRLALELGPFAVWFRRFLMRQYFARYRRPARAPSGSR